jgi:hypothetical protein
MQISNGGGASPNWSRTAAELLYLARTQIMAVPYAVNGNAVTADSARPRATAQSVVLQDLFDETILTIVGYA